MKSAKLSIDKSHVIGNVDPNLYSSFIEHLGRAVYTGIYEPGHKTADAQGFRRDVIDLVKELGVSLVRYPGGNFVSGFNWRDSIGPRSERPKRLELAWHSIETNEIGIDEFADWAKKAGTGVMAAVNLGTGTPQEAGNLLEYCNFPGGTYYSDLRAQNGHKEPHNIKVWCLGNEMDGPWQICSLSAEDYGKKALETAKIMKWIDKDVKLIVCGSSNSGMPSFPQWDRTVLEYTYDQVDYLSLHSYYFNHGSDADFLASFMDMDQFIDTVIATADYVKSKKRGKKDIMLSFDEWNIWYPNDSGDHPWQQAPALLENQYSLLDALVLGGLACSLINHASRVKIACLAQLVNVIAPIFTQKGGAAIRQTIFYPFMQVSRYGRGTALRAQVEAPEVATDKYGAVKGIYASAVHDEKNGELAVFALNLDKEDLSTAFDLRSFGKASVIEHTVLRGDKLDAVNTFDHPDAVGPVQAPVNAGESGSFELTLPALSWNLVRFKIK